MSVATSTAGPGRPVRAWARALVLLLALGLALLVAPSTAAPAGAPVPPPAAAASAEPGELQQDSPEAALRLPTGHPTRLPGDPRRSRPVPATAPGTCPDPGAHPARQSLRALRTVVLRC
ncbi:hypothetical protein OKJ48_02900 [Streptomyces kunmingensis]|uniref:Secreted protein n=1 Tax=Streptomyces kunmingensis TaxID=68225 RepID=A0ABU6C3V1_9ACTN|nr:hypothetical protein [Streptomyces kunmingensis]MEB3959209.1 hypothetical protein [Streptomyces kunmingensis]